MFIIGCFGIARGLCVVNKLSKSYFAGHQLSRSFFKQFSFKLRQFDSRFRLSVTSAKEFMVTIFILVANTSAVLASCLANGAVEYLHLARPVASLPLTK